MIYEHKISIPASTKTVKLQVSPCVNCSSEKIKIEEYEDQFGYISTAKCSNCSKVVKDNTNATGIIEKWNAQNDIERLLVAKQRLIEVTKIEIVQLKKLQKQRSSKANHVQQRPIS